MALPQQGWWQGNQFILPPVARTPRRRFDDLEPVIQGPLLPSNGSNPPQEYSSQGGGEGTGGGLLGGGREGGISSGEGTGFASVSPSMSVNPSNATVGGLLGTAAGFATGLPGAGLLGGALGGFMDAKGVNKDLAATGTTARVSPAYGALQGMMPFGALGTPTDQISNALNAAMSTPEGRASTSPATPGGDLGQPDESLGPTEVAGPLGDVDRGALGFSNSVSSQAGSEIDGDGIGFGLDAAAASGGGRGGFGADTGAAGMGGVGGGASGEAGGNYGAVGGENSHGAGGGGGEGGGSVICTELVRQGLMSKERKAESRKHAQECLSPEIVRGYQWWAVTVVRWMRKSPRVTKIVEKLAEWRGIEIAYRLGLRDEGDLRGWAVQEFGAALSYVIGRVVKQRDYSGLYHA